MVVASLSVVTWNIAAVNNNPFEYWITHPSPDYNKLMSDVENFLNEPGDNDIMVQDVFTPAMWEELKQEMRENMSTAWGMTASNNAAADSGNGEKSSETKGADAAAEGGDGGKLSMETAITLTEEFWNGPALL